MTPVRTRPRIDSIDFLRGAVMVLMALDHTRDFFGASLLDPRDVADAPLFLTRWVTHFCAPVFVFLAGTSAYLYGRKTSAAGLRRFLFTRGLWLILLEFTVVRVAWTFDVVPGFVAFQVIWVIGCAMLALAALVALPARAVAALGIALVAGQDLLHGVDTSALGIPAWLWTLLYATGPLEAPVRAFVAYPLLPWIGVIAVGYGFGELVVRPPAERRRLLRGLGLGVVAGFVVLRALGGYGDPAPWAVQATPGQTLLSFLNCTKYPPSLAYLAMTLGPAILLLGALDGRVGAWARPVVEVGRVPLLYYVAHVYLIHLAIVALTSALGGAPPSLLEGFHPMDKAPGFGFSLPVVYVAWLGVVLALYPLCLWFAAVKARRRDWWLSYL